MAVMDGMAAVTIDMLRKGSYSKKNDITSDRYETIIENKLPQKSLLPTNREREDSPP